MKMAAPFGIDDERIASANQKLQPTLREDFDHLAHVLRRTHIDIEGLVARAAAFTVAIPSWGVGTGGTRFARFPGPGEPRDIHEKLDDCAVVFRLVRATRAVSVHIPWDRVESPAALRAFAAERGLHFDAMNSYTFQDHPDQALSY
jgi:L-rhamnose isomerase/sugar isomerase